jgi:threonine synthase
MLFRSTKTCNLRQQVPLVSFEDAVFHCLPPDRGLYIPDEGVDLRQFFLQMDENTSFKELVAAVTNFDGRKF